MKLIELLEEIISNKKNGEIARFKHNNLWYLIQAFEEPYKDDKVVAFNIFVSKKSSKSRDIENTYSLAKVNRQYTLGGGDVSVLKNIVNTISLYLKKWSPKYLGISAFSKDDWVKRINFYIKVLNRLGYEAIGHYDKKNDPGTLVFAKKGESKKVFTKAGYDKENRKFYFETDKGKINHINW